MGPHETILHLFSKLYQVYPPLQSPSSPGPTKSFSGDPSRLFALVIGINRYRHENKLQGAVADADAVLHFLTSVLGVPERNVRNLRDKAATAEAIKEGIKAFATDYRIQPGDPILIYYAGHGARTAAPSQWNLDGEIELLIPFDFISETTNSERGQGVLGRTISTLLQSVAGIKGDNIVVILDSCFSGSATRSEGGTIYRNYPLPDDYQVYHEVDDKMLDDDKLFAIEATRLSETPSHLIHAEMRSHVILAACRHNEKAGEFKRGYFTDALLKVLEDPEVDLRTVSYPDLISRLPDLPSHKDQHPLCEGVYKDRLLFSSLIPECQERVYQVNCDNKSRLIIQAGEAYEITCGTEFTIYGDASCSTKPLGKARVTSVKVYQSVLKLISQPVAGDAHMPPDVPKRKRAFEFPNISYALRTRPGPVEPSIKIFVDQDTRSTLSLPFDENGRSALDDLLDIKLVSNRNDADLALNCDKDGLEFEFLKFLDNICVDYGLSRTLRHKRNTKDDISAILRAASHFYIHLRRPLTPKCSNSDSGQQDQEPISSSENSPIVTVECHRVKPVIAKGAGCFVPLGDNHNRNGIIEVDAVAEDCSLDDEELPVYGFRVKNASSFNFYAWVFFFNCTDMSIETRYQPPTMKGGTSVSCLPVGGFIDIGRGSTVRPASVFKIANGRKVDVGFFKVFLSTEYVDFSDVSQSSPFDPGRFFRPYFPKYDLWFGPYVPVIQKLTQM